jgi:hypothetical protein
MIDLVKKRVELSEQVPLTDCLEGLLTNFAKSGSTQVTHFLTVEGGCPL